MNYFARQEKWLQELGEFTQLTPHEAAERWGVSLQVALERLHELLGFALYIPVGKVEVYEHLPTEPLPPAPPSQEDVIQQRLDAFPSRPVKAAELALVWHVSRDTVYSTLKILQARNLVAHTHIKAAPCSPCVNLWNKLDANERNNTHE